MTLEWARIAVLIPAHNEERQIAGVLARLPAYVDHAVVVDDASTDDTGDVVAACASRDPRVELIRLPDNRGVGGALAEGYAWARRNDVDIAVSMDGDGQMDPDDMVALLRPILDGRADYTKGNRLTQPEAWRQIPRVRLFGNGVLSLLTKIVSGYWNVADSQSGYSAASRRALHAIPWGEMYPRYGRPNDVLILANVANCRVADVPIRPVYGVGERSGMKIMRVTLAISFLLFRRFWWRLWRKYVIQDFHPLLFFYGMAGVSALLATVLGIRFVWAWAANGHVPPMTALGLAFMVVTMLNSLFFAFWMDREANQHLSVPLVLESPTDRVAARRLDGGPGDPTLVLRTEPSEPLAFRGHTGDGSEQ